MKHLLADAINRMPDRERLVLTLYYYEALTLAEIGTVLGVTESRVCQIHTKAILQLRGRLDRTARRASLGLTGPARPSTARSPTVAITSAGSRISRLACARRPVGSRASTSSVASLPVPAHAREASVESRSPLAAVPCSRSRSRSVSP